MIKIYCNYKEGNSYTILINIIVFYRRDILKKLSIIEKICLCIKGKSDAKKALFQEVTGTTILFQNPKISLGQNSILISPFIVRELQQFKGEREYFIFHKVFRVRKSEEKLGKIMVFGKAIDLLEKSLSDLEAEIYIEETEYAKKKELLECEYEKYQNRMAAIKRLKECELKIRQSENEYLKKQGKNYQAAIFLLYEEMRILEQMQAFLILKKNHRFLRIQYYYEKANLKQLSLAAMTDDVLNKIGGLVELGKKYEDILKEIETMENVFKDKYVGSTVA